MLPSTDNICRCLRHCETHSIAPFPFLFAAVATAVVTSISERSVTSWGRDDLKRDGNIKTACGEEKRLNARTGSLSLSAGGKSGCAASSHPFVEHKMLS